MTVDGVLTAVAEKSWAVGAVDMEHVGIAGGSDAEISLYLLAMS
jgi:hypothetical protein